MTTITERYHRLRAEVPPDVKIVLAVKRRTADEIAEAIRAGATDLGENYVQEAVAVKNQLGEMGGGVTWHLIGHLQKNKINQALPVFDVIQTVDSLHKAEQIDTRAERAGRKIVPVMIELNIAGEAAKAGVNPLEHQPFDEYLVDLVRRIASLQHITVEGLMTMGPVVSNVQKLQPYFRQVASLHRLLRSLDIPDAPVTYLSMGMSDSYRLAIDEGANMIRVGTVVFGKRPV